MDAFPEARAGTRRCTHKPEGRAGDNIKNDCASRELHAHSGGRPEDAGDGLAREVWLSV